MVISFYGNKVTIHLTYICLRVCVCVGSILASCNESESEGSVPELEESEPLRPSEHQVIHASFLETLPVLSQSNYF